MSLQFCLGGAVGMGDGFVDVSILVQEASLYSNTD